MLTGVPSVAKITAVIPSTVYELAKEDLAPILEARPEVAHEFSRALAQHQAAGRSTASVELGESVPMSALTRWFSERLRRLHELAPNSHRRVELDAAAAQLLPRSGSIAG